MFAIVNTWVYCVYLTLYGCHIKDAEQMEGRGWLQLCMVISCTSLGQKHYPCHNYLCRAPSIAGVGTISNVFSYDAL